MNYIFAVFILGMFTASQSEHYTTFYFKDYEELTQMLTRHHYSATDWPSHDTVPRLYIKSIPQKWATISKTVPTAEKKKMFFTVIEPLILHANQELMIVRKKVISLQKQKALTPQDSTYLINLQKHYRMKSPEQINYSELLNRVDIVAPSLALAQAAVESAWATSKFASQGNALYGQWAWGEGAMTPSQKRSGLGNYGIKAFDTPLESVNGYMYNLNTHAAYASFRVIRSEQRKKSMVNGSDLANGLIKYSENGQTYINTLQSIIRVNGLLATDNDQLLKMDPVIVAPAPPVASK